MSWQDEYKELRVQNATRQSVDLVYANGDTVTVKSRETKRIKTAGLVNAPSLMKFRYIGVEINDALLVKLGLMDPPPPPVVLVGITLSVTSIVAGQSYNAVITGKTAGSTLALVGAAAAGLTIVGNTVVGVPTTPGSFAVLETLPNAINSPKLNENVVTVLPAPVILDAPINTGLVAKTYVAWSPHRFIEGYTGPTVQLQRLSDNAVKDFYPSITGECITDLVQAWDPANKSIYVKVYSQIAGQPDLIARGTVYFINGTAKSFTTDIDPATGQLTRRTNNRGIGADLGGIGDFTTVTPITAPVSTKGMKLFQLASLYSRKISSADTSDPIGGGNNSRENMLSYGADSTATQFFNYFGGGAWLDSSRVQAGGAQVQPNGRGLSRYKANSQMVTLEVLGLTEYKTIEHGKRVKQATLAAGTVSAIAAGAFDNKYVGVGCVLSGTGAFGTTNRMNGVWGGLILTEATTTADQDELIQAKMSMFGQPHLAIPLNELLAMTDDGIDFMTANSTTGLVTSRNSQFAIQLNTSGSTWAYGAMQADVGIKGLRAPDLSTLNSFQATTNYFWDAIKGGGIVFGYTETNAQSGNLAWQFAMAAGNPQVDNRGDWSLAIGNHHSTPALVTKPAASKDPQGLVIGNRFYEDETQLGSTAYDDGNGQEHIKYAYVNPLRNLSYVTVDKAGNVFTKAVLEKTDTVLKKLRDPIYPPFGDNINYPFKVEQSCLQIATWEPDPAYVVDAPYADRKATLSKGISKLYVSGGGICPLGHVDGSIGIDTTTPVRDADPTHRIQTQFFQYPWQGIRRGLELVDFGKRGRATWTFLEAQKLQANNYKRYAA